jgi:hypothetical protein
MAVNFLAVAAWFTLGAVVGAILMYRYIRNQFIPK